MTAERMQWYVEVIEHFSSPVGGDGGRIPDLQGTDEGNIHNDEAYARAQGLPGIIADGPISMNWLLGLIVDHFGEDSVGDIEFSVKHIRPVRKDMLVVPKLQIEEVVKDGNSSRTLLKIWTETEGGDILCVGSAELTSSGNG